MPVDVTNPETWGIVAMLFTAIIALVRGAILPGITHDKIIAQLNSAHAEQIGRLERECDLWRQIALRGVQLSETSLDVIKEVRGAKR